MTLKYVSVSENHQGGREGVQEVVVSEINGFGGVPSVGVLLEGAIPPKECTNSI